MIDELADAGCDAIVAGCTEITLLVDPHDVPLPVHDTTAIHAETAVEHALREPGR
jgi:aspartate racemase